MVSPIVLKNKYEPLDSISIDDNNDEKKEDTEKQSEEENPDTRKKKVPVITLTNEDRQDTINALAAQAVDFTVRNGATYSRLYAKSMDEWSAIMDYCKKEKKKGYSHAVSSNSHLHTVIFDIPSHTVESIQAALEDANKRPSKIVQFGRSATYKHYAIDFPRGTTTIKDLNANCARLGNLEIEWKPNKRPDTGPTMCFNCLMYGHGQRYCTRDPLCAECGAGHHTSNRTNRTSTTAIIQCANCVANGFEDASEHMVTDANCHTRAKYIAHIEAKKKRSRSQSSGRSAKNRRVDFNLQSTEWPRIMVQHSRTDTNNRKIVAANDSSAVNIQPVASTSSGRGRSRTPVRTRTSSVNNGSTASTSYAQAVSKENELFTLTELVNIMMEASSVLLSQDSKAHQLNAMMSLFAKWLGK